MANELERRVQERRVYEQVVELIINYVSKEFHEEAPRLRIYSMVASNFEGMVRALTHPPSSTSAIESIISGENKDG